jgi:hypothetical protein
VLEQDHSERQLNHSKEALRMVLIADYGPAKIVEPSEQSLNPPTAAIATQRPKILGLPAIGPLGGYHLDAKLGQEMLVQRVSVVGLIPTARDSSTSRTSHHEALSIHMAKADQSGLQLSWSWFSCHSGFSRHRALFWSEKRCRG